MSLETCIAQRSPLSPPFILVFFLPSVILRVDLMQTSQTVLIVWLQLEEDRVHWVAVIYTNRTRQYLTLCLERNAEILVALHLDKWDENPQDPACGPHEDTWVSSLFRGDFSSTFTGEMSESCLIFVSSLAICLFETKAALSQGEHSVALTAAQHCGGHGITKQRHCCSRTDSYQLKV